MSSAGQQFFSYACLLSRSLHVFFQRTIASCIYIPQMHPHTIA
jgi:hypothetical protein